MIKYLHKSQAQRYRKCSQQFYLADVLELPPSFENETGLAGQAFHSFAEQIYKQRDKWNDTKYWVEYFISELNKRKANCIEEGIEINSPEDLKIEEYAEMIYEFQQQDYNRYAEPILLEAPFRFSIKKNKKTYWFEGTIDQLLKIETKYLQQFTFPFFDTKSMDYFRTAKYVYIHRDIKSGKRQIISELGLMCNDDINFYSYGLAFGLFNLSGLPGTFTVSVHHIPFAHCLYWVRDHLKYKRATDKKAKGDYRGEAMYFFRKPLEELRAIEDELVNMHIKVNSGNYTRDAAGTVLCDVHCQWKAPCLYGLKKARGTNGKENSNDR
jgi:hypothetical protein